MLAYYNMFDQYINLLSIIGGGLKIAFLSFIGVLIILIVFRKKVLIQRRHTALKYLARSYYFFIPLICLGFGFVYGAISTTRDNIIERLPVYQADIQQIINSKFDIQMNAYVNVNTEQSLSELLDESIATSQQTLVASLQTNDLNHNIAQNMVITIMSSPMALDFAKNKITSGISGQTGIDETLLIELSHTKLSDIFTGETILKIIAFQINKLTHTALTPIIVLWIIFLLLPILEIIFAVRYDARKRTIN